LKIGSNTRLFVYYKLIYKCNKLNKIREKTIEERNRMKSEKNDYLNVINWNYMK